MALQAVRDALKSSQGTPKVTSGSQELTGLFCFQRSRMVVHDADSDPGSRVRNRPAEPGDRLDDQEHLSGSGNAQAT